MSYLQQAIENSCSSFESLRANRTSEQDLTAHMCLQITPSRVTHAGGLPQLSANVKAESKLRIG
jgi:hypothetical protein